MVEGEVELLHGGGDGPQLRLVGIGAGHDLADLGCHGEVGDGDHVRARITVGVTVGTELSEVPGGDDARLLA